MRVFIYNGGLRLVGKSGVGQAILHQREMLRRPGMNLQSNYSPGHTSYTLQGYVDFLPGAVPWYLSLIHIYHLASAPHSHCGGRRFESDQVH